MRVPNTSWSNGSSGQKLDAVRRDIAAQNKRVLDVLGNLDKLKDLDAVETEYQNEKRDTEFRLGLFREHGVEEQLKRQVQFNADVTHARRAVDTVDTFVRDVEGFLAEQESELAALPRLEPTENQDVMDALNTILDRIRKVPEKLRSVIGEAAFDSPCPAGEIR